MRHFILEQGDAISVVYLSYWSFRLSVRCAEIRRPWYHSGFLLKQGLGSSHLIIMEGGPEELAKKKFAYDILSKKKFVSDQNL